MQHCNSGSTNWFPMSSYYSLVIPFDTKSQRLLSNTYLSFYGYIEDYETILWEITLNCVIGELGVGYALTIGFHCYSSVDFRVISRYGLKQ